MNSRVATEVQGYLLCSQCAERQGTASREFDLAHGEDCSICRGAMDRIHELADAAARRAREFEFRTFSVGVTMPEGVQEMEDELRSYFKLKGNETIKTQAGRLLASRLSRLLRRRVDKRRPDATILVDFGSRIAGVVSRPVFYCARYTKPSGVLQRVRLCEVCRGSGCKKCRGTGREPSPSVEEALRKRLAKLGGSDKITFTWLGSEDRSSVVYPPGRPFIAELKNPKKRRLPKKFGIRLRAGLVSVSHGRVLPSRPVRLPAFRFLTRIRATSASKVPAGRLAELRSRFRRTTVRFDRPHNKPTTKMVYRLSGSADGRKLLIDAEIDGGLPVKRLVNGELVSPSVSEVLKTEVSCRSFDICRVKEIGGFGFAEVARNKEKD